MTLDTAERITDPAPAAETRTLEVPGALLTYDVRRGAAGTAPTLVLVGSPMGAHGFTTLAGHFADRTVVTYDPRGVERSRRLDGSVTSTPEMHADDISRLIAAVDAGPVDLFASSGGAVNALALVSAHPEQLHTVVAHEPPLGELLPDREVALKVTSDIHETYQRSGLGPAMAKFIMLAMHQGELTQEYLERPAPDPAAFGLPTTDDGSRDDPLLGQNLLSGTGYRPDLDKLKDIVRAGEPRLVIAAGAGSAGELAHRGARAVAEALGTPLTMFPSDHGGFLGGEYGQTGDPDAFAAALREVLSGH